ncbi:MAG: FTR1 family iron permease [Thermomicrobiales bacterium]
MQTGLAARIEHSHVGHQAWRIVLAIGGLAVLVALVWQGITASGNPDPTSPHLSHNAIVMNTALLVFREGLEAILVLAAITATFIGGSVGYRKPVAVGAGVGIIASIATWFIVIAIIDAVNAPALYIQAVTGVLAIVVLLIIMNWFFHRIYWSGWISHHNRRKRHLMAEATTNPSKLMIGLILLGFTAIYREGFEIVLFLQSMRLQAGSGIVVQGVAIGLIFTAIIAVLTFLAHHKLPYKKMLVLTGIMLGVVLVVMVGESVQELQLAGWMSTTPLNLPIPDWMGLWFALFPNVEGILAQVLAAGLVIGSYYLASNLGRPAFLTPKRNRLTP